MAKIILLFLFILFTVKSFSQKELILSKLSVIKLSCAGIDTMSLNIFKEENIISAQFYNRGNNMGLTPKTSALTSQQYISYKKFVKELKRFKGTGGCTTLYIYKLEENGKVIEKADGKCKWYGIEKLLKELYPD